MKSRLIIVVVALVLGGVAAVGAYAYLGAVQRAAETGSVMTDVVVAKQAIPRGVAASDLISGGYVQTVRMPLKYVSAGAISSVASVSDRVLAVPVDQGEVLTSARFQYPSEAGLAFAVPKDFVAVAIPVDEARGVGDLVKPGDRVAVLGTVQMKSGGPDETRIMVAGAKVLAVGQSTSAAANPSQTQQSGLFAAAQSGSSASSPTKTITVAVSAADAEKIVLAVEAGTVWLALLPGDQSSVVPGPGQTEATVLR